MLVVFVCLSYLVGFVRVENSVVGRRIHEVLQRFCVCAVLISRHIVQVCICCSVPTCVFVDLGLVTSGEALAELPILGETRSWRAPHLHS